MKKIATVDEPIPNFNISATNGLKGEILQFQGKNLILFFYPKDNTPVCTSEAKAFRDHFNSFTEANCLIFGISRDNLDAHERFKKRLDLPFELISDSSEQLCNYFDVIGSKNFFGKKISGIIRSTFLIDQKGVLKKAWRKIKVAGHIETVLREAQSLNVEN